MRATSYSAGKDAEGASLFFSYLSEWSEADRAAQQFEAVINKPIAAPQTVLLAQLYHRLVDFLLEKLQLARSDSPAQWEWKPLYEFGLTADPHYFTEAEIEALLDRWPLIGYQRRQVMVAVLADYLRLRRGGFPECYPSPLMPVHEVERWTRIFPAEWAWESAGVLRAVGFATLVGRQAYRAFARFTDGTFEPRLDNDGLRRWMAECHRAADLPGGKPPERSLPYQASFLAATFAGHLPSMGVEGPCRYVPDCGHCPISAECRWFNTPLSEQPRSPEVLAASRRGQLASLRPDQLLHALYNLKDGEADRLRVALNGATLRDLAGMSFEELDLLCGDQWLLPERLTVMFELCRRFNEERMEVGNPFQTPWDIFKHFRLRLRDLKQEQFIAVLLDHKKRYLSDRVVTQGTLNASPVHPREVFSAAIRERAAFVLVVHNHPSGDPTPSREDIHVTQQLVKVGELVGIPVLDHIIIADELYVSLMEQGLMQG